MIFQGYLLIWAPLALLLLLLWGQQNKTQNANAADVAWAFGFCWAAVVLFALGSGHLRSYLVLFLVCFWSLRLGNYLLVNRVLKEPREDGRYQRLRAELGWGKKQFFFVFQFQALLVLAWSFALMPSFQNALSLKAVDIVGLVWGLLCILGEALSDRQLNQFRAMPENKGKTCQLGLWNYSRHPNYFFEWCFWWSFVFLSYGSEYFLYSLIGPVLMGLFLWKITGIPATERQAARSRSDYKEYQQSTSAFIPWFKKG